MKSLTLILMLALVSTAAVIVANRPRASHAAPAAADHTTADSSSFALLELFTSEGCSSCPSADKLLGTIASEARKSGAHIIPLAFHVDYWNRLGWTDPFSSRAYAERQYAYAGALKLDGVYTPQLIVNGRSQFVGSDESKMREEIRSALAIHAQTRITLSASAAESDPRIVHVTYHLDGSLPDDAVLNLALVERGLSTNVPRGENAGRTLRHENVVRLFRSIDAARDGSETLEIGDGVKIENASVVAFVQEKRAMGIAGAAMVDVER